MNTGVGRRCAGGVAEREEWPEASLEVERLEWPEHSAETTFSSAAIRGDPDRDEFPECIPTSGSASPAVAGPAVSRSDALSALAHSAEAAVCASLGAAGTNHRSTANSRGGGAGGGLERSTSFWFAASMSCS